MGEDGRLGEAWRAGQEFARSVYAGSCWGLAGDLACPDVQRRPLSPVAAWVKTDAWGRHGAHAPGCLRQCVAPPAPCCTHAAQALWHFDWRLTAAPGTLSLQLGCTVVNTKGLRTGRVSFSHTAGCGQAQASCTREGDAHAGRKGHIEFVHYAHSLGSKVVLPQVLHVLHRCCQGLPLLQLHATAPVSFAAVSLAALISTGSAGQRS